MACKYRYNGVTYESELALDQVLLHEDWYSEYLSDAVFSRLGIDKTKLESKLEKLTETFTEEKKKNVKKAARDAIFKLLELNEKYDQAVAKNKITLVDGMIEDGDDIDGGIKAESPYIGVTDMIHGLTQIDENGSIRKLFPEFNSENYWNKRAGELANAINIVESEKTISEQDRRIKHADIPYIFDEVDSEGPNTIKIDGKFYKIENITSEQLPAIRKRIESVWMSEAKMGTAVHNIFTEFFYGDKSRYYTTHSDAEILENIKKPSSKLKKEDLDWISDEAILDTINKCKLYKAELESQFGKDCIITPEVGITAIADIDGERVEVVGRIDLLVIDNTGTANIIDFKCSPKIFGDYASEKVLTFDYQLTSYKKMLEQSGITNNKSKVYVTPIIFSNFTVNKDDDTCSFTGIEFDSNVLVELLENNPNLKGKVEKNLNEVFPPKDFILDLSDNETLTEVDKFMKKCAPGYERSATLLTPALAKTKLMRLLRAEDDEDFAKKLEKCKKNGKYVIKIGQSSTIEASSPEELLAKVKQYFESAANDIASTTKNIKERLKEGIENDERIEFRYATHSGSTAHGEKGYQGWINNILANYAVKGLYEVVDAGHAFDELGIILIRNTQTNRVDVIKVSHQMTDTTLRINDRKLLLGAYQSDELSKGIPKQLTMESTHGNWELMETMAALNCRPKFFTEGDKVIGEIRVINFAQNYQEGTTASNKQLLWNFRQLCKLGKFENKFTDYNETMLTQQTGIKMMSHAEKIKDMFNSLMSYNNLVYNEETGYEQYLQRGFIRHTKNLKPVSENILNKEELLVSLHDLRRELENERQQYEIESKHGNSQVSIFQNIDNMLYMNVMEAIAELEGLDLVQQVDDHDKYLQASLNASILTEGVNGTYTDNPGTLQNENINKLATLVSQAYQNARITIVSFNGELQQKLKELKASKNFGYLASRTFQNQAKALYSNMYDEDAKLHGELLFKNPWDNSTNLTESEREFLKYAILEFAKDRWGIVDENDSRFQNKLFNNLEELLRVPLCAGDFSARVSNSDGLLSAIRGDFKRKMPRLYNITHSDDQSTLSVKERLMHEISGIFDNESEVYDARKEMYKMVNQFDAGEKPNIRSKMINQYGVDYWETNVEKLLLRHRAAKAKQEELDKVFPLIKAVALHTKYQGIFQNNNFENDLQYIHDYIRNKIFNMPIDDLSKTGEAKLVINKLMGTASKLALAFNPRLLYQILDGIWKDIRLYVQYSGLDTEDSKNPFTKENLVGGFMWAITDLAHFGDDKSYCEAVNETYGLNDQDMNTLLDRIANDRSGWDGFWTFGFRFASRPDFYNRLTIFGAQMREDGCFYAHEVRNGVLYYDEKKDKRFTHYLNNEVNDPNYKKEKALYEMMAKQFEIEGAKYSDGTLFRYIPDNYTTYKRMPLPRAYTNLQVQSMKQFADKIYGYYNHESKSMLQAFTIGSMLMQMNTYWSSKKNQYLSGRGYTMEGEYVQYKEPIRDENGEPLLDAEGNYQMQAYWMDEEGNPTTENTGVPFIVWKGKPSEGIVVTVATLIKACAGQVMEGNSIWKGFDELRNNPDPVIRNLYKANMRLLLYDLFMLISFGKLIAPAIANAAKSYCQEVLKTDPSFLDVALGNLGVMQAEMLTASFDDFNATKSIFGRGMQWTPFSIQTINRIVENYTGVFDGSKDLYDAIINTPAALKTTRPIWDYVKFEVTGRHIGQSYASTIKE